jgi:hypothetical protein
MDFEPVKGWIAIPAHISSNREHADTYRILYCPEYREDVRK